MNQTVVPNDWVLRLASAIAAALREFAPRIVEDAVVMIAVDCHPWHGRLGLAALTESEVAADQLLADPTEMAAWRHYDFTRNLEVWKQVPELGAVMRIAYEEGDRPVVAEAFLCACAEAVLESQVRESLSAIPRAVSFRVSVRHPDNGREFVSLS